ncbi:MAG: hypothetical protein HY289_04680 [Planctomycetes bacterium]|nr:hypothetical protein [Planctomycetota bacterium]
MSLVGGTDVDPIGLEHIQLGRFLPMCFIHFTTPLLNETHETHETRETRETHETRETRETHETRETRETRETKLKSMRSVGSHVADLAIRHDRDPDLPHARNTLLSTST